jgi:hypothetical protein
MDTDDLSEDEEMLLGMDMVLFEVEKDVARNTFYVSLLVALHGLTFLFFAWMADSGLMTVVAGLIGGIIFLFGIFVTWTNFKARLKMFAKIEEMKEAHPALEPDSTIAEYSTLNTSENDDN